MKFSEQLFYLGIAILLFFTLGLYGGRDIGRNQANYHCEGSK